MKSEDLSKAVIDIQGVEYLINPETADLIKNRQKEIPLLRLFDKKIIITPLEEVEKSIEENGIIDYLS